MPELKPPVIIIGAPRSGTTMMFRLLSSAPGMCGWYEPATIWRTGHAYRRWDEADASDAKPWVKRRVRSLFRKFQEARGGCRIVEKSPRNTLRVPFVHTILPEARIVHIYRDGRANLRSSIERHRDFGGHRLNRSNIVKHLVRRMRLPPGGNGRLTCNRISERISAGNPPISGASDTAVGERTSPPD